MRVLLLSVCLALSACASPNWVNPRNPVADLQADAAACDKDAERMARMDQISGQPAGACLSGPHCSAITEQHRLKVVAGAVAAQKRCMAARGWRQA